MSFTKEIDFSKYGIDIKITPEMVELPKTIRNNILPAKRSGTTVSIKQKNNSQITLNLASLRKKGTYGEGWLTDTKIDGKSLMVKILKTDSIKSGDREAYEYDIIQELFTQIIIYESTKDLRYPEINLVGPFAAQFFMVGKDEYNYYIVSETLDGDVDQHVKGSVNPDLTFLKISTTQIAKILLVLYDKIRYNHRDLKPDNIMYKIINGKINIRLIDFGFSCFSYRSLTFAPISNSIYARDLHCDSTIRDMHQYLYYLHYYSYYDRKDGKFNKCPMKRLLEALITNDIYDLGPYADKAKNPNWTGTYDSYNISNSIRSKQQALNAHPKVVYNVFKSLSIINPLAACSEISKDWVKHLVKIYKPTYLYLDKDNVKHLTDGAEITFDLPTPLETALVNNNVDDIYKLLSTDALLSREAFFFNVRNVRDPLLLDLLFDKYAVVGGINNTYKSYTALHFATLYNNKPLISKLISLEGIVISKQSAKGETCLHIAAKMASGKFYQDPLTDKPISVTPDATDIAFDIVKLLLDRYPALADINDNNGKSPGNKEYVVLAIHDYIKSKKTTLLGRVLLGQNKEKTARIRGGKKGKRRGTKRRRNVPASAKVKYPL